MSLGYQDVHVQFDLFCTSAARVAELLLSVCCHANLSVNALKSW